MKENRIDIDELIGTYLTARLDTSSLEELKAWIAESPENEKYFMQKQEIWFSALAGKESDVYNKDVAFQRFKQQIAGTGKLRNTPLRKAFRFWRYAAVVALLAALSYFSYWQGGVHVKANFSDIVVEAPLGSKTKLFLPDGTLVWLNAGSRLTYSQGFGVDNRKLELDGEGYFEVYRNENIPFVVKSKDLEVEVLGTVFNFCDYQEDEEAIVSLLKGKVELNNLLKAENKVCLLPNQRASLNKTNGRINIKTVTASNASQWTNGYLFFDEELLPDIAQELERSYNVKISIESAALMQLRFYGNLIRREQSLNEVLEVLSSTGKIRYRTEGRNVVLYEP